MVSLNNYLLWLWQTNQKEIRKLISEYSQIISQEEKEQGEKQIEEMQKKGISTEEIRKWEQINSCVTSSKNYSKFINDFFANVAFIETNYVSQVEETSYKLNFYENKFKIKTHLISVFVVAIELELEIRKAFFPPR